MITFLKGIYHYLLAWAGNILYGFPSKNLYVFGVTGTKGKSTTVELVSAILEAAGKKTALLSSIRFKIDRETRKNSTGTTMPGRFFIQRFLRQAAGAGCEYAIIEVTSQGILQHRHRFIQWDASAFLNVRPEHIEAHGSFEIYREAKVSFFRYAAKKSKKARKLFFVNEEDPSSFYFSAAVNGSGEVKYYGRQHFIENELNGGRESIGDWLSNNFNLENAALAAIFARSQGIGWPIIKKALENFKGVPGRLETIQEKPFKVVIDYAHTPDSLEKIYQTLVTSDKRHATSKRLICVLGAAGGGRDKWKRPVMGKIAAEYCREIVLTNEDPYDENPDLILQQIETGFSQIPNSKFPIPKNYWKILDRREAIGKAISMAKKGDTVIITGKGSEDFIHVAHGNKISWNEREVVESVLNKY